jgi:hypothetical protein
VVAVVPAVLAVVEDGYLGPADRRHQAKVTSVAAVRMLLILFSRQHLAAAEALEVVVLRGMLMVFLQSVVAEALALHRPLQGHLLHALVVATGLMGEMNHIVPAPLLVAEALVMVTILSLKADLPPPEAVEVVETLQERAVLAQSSYQSQRPNTAESQPVRLS